MSSLKATAKRATDLLRMESFSDAAFLVSDHFARFGCSADLDEVDKFLDHFKSESGVLGPRFLSYISRATFSGVILYLQRQGRKGVLRHDRADIEEMARSALENLMPPPAYKQGQRVYSRIYGKFGTISHCSNQNKPEKSFVNGYRYSVVFEDMTKESVLETDLTPQDSK